jgi:hypothetical protein
MGTRKPDKPYRHVKSAVTLRGRKRKEHAQPTLGQLMKRARGVVNSGISDLASNPRHLKYFGRDGSQR